MTTAEKVAARNASVGTDGGGHTTERKTRERLSLVIERSFLEGGEANGEA